MGRLSFRDGEFPDGAGLGRRSLGGGGGGVGAGGGRRHGCLVGETESGISDGSGRSASRAVLLITFSPGKERRWNSEISEAGLLHFTAGRAWVEQGWDNRTDWEDVHRGRTCNEKGHASERGQAVREEMQ